LCECVCVLQAFQAGTPGNEFWVIHVWGTPYEVLGAELVSQRLGFWFLVTVPLRFRVCADGLRTRPADATRGSRFGRPSLGVSGAAGEAAEPKRWCPLHCALSFSSRTPPTAQVEEYLQGIPNWLSEDMANFGLDVALDMTVQFTQNFTGSYFFEELQGVCIGLRR
jgi:hypothetical protein